MEEEKDSEKQYSILCATSFIIVLEIALLKILDLFSIIMITKFGFDLLSYSCIIAFLFSIVGLIKFNSNKSKGKWMGIIGIALSPGLFLSDMEISYFLILEIIIIFIFLIHFIFKKIFNKK